jgi:hypothetical protein
VVVVGVLWSYLGLGWSGVPWQPAKLVVGVGLRLVSPVGHAIVDDHESS